MAVDVVVALGAQGGGAHVGEEALGGRRRRWRSVRREAALAPGASRRRSVGGGVARVGERRTRGARGE
jgi:hypothetical protein